MTIKAEGINRVDGWCLFLCWPAKILFTMEVFAMPTRLEQLNTAAKKAQEKRDVNAKMDLSHFG